MRYDGRAHPLGGFDGRLFMGVPQGRATPLKRRLHRIVALAAEGMFLLLPRKYGGSSLSRSYVLVADVGRGLIKELKRMAYVLLVSFNNHTDTNAKGEQ